MQIFILGYKQRKEGGRNKQGPLTWDVIKISSAILKLWDDTKYLLSTDLENHSTYQKVY